MTNSTNSTGYPNIANLTFHIIINSEGILGLIGNTVLLLVIRRYRKLRTPSVIVLANLSVADIINSVVQPIVTSLFLLKSATLLTQWKFACYVRLTLTIYAAGGNTFFLSLLTIDKLIVVRYPRFYHRHMTISNIKKIIFVVWIILTIMILNTAHNSAIVPQKYCILTEVDTTMAERTTIIQIILMAAQILMSIYVMWYFHKQMKAIGALAGTEAFDPIQNSKIKKKRRMMRLILQIMTVYVISYLPIIIFVQYDITHPLRLAVNAFFNINSFLNPLIAFQASNFKAALYHLLKVKTVLNPTSTRPSNIHTGLSVLPNNNQRLS